MAGYIDGEGSVRWSHGPCLEITNTHRESLEEIQTYLGGKIHNTNPNNKNSKHRPCYRLTIHGESAEKVLFDLLPWLIIKKQQAEAVLQLASARRTNTLTPEVLAEGLEFLKVDKQVAFDTRADE